MFDELIRELRRLEGIQRIPNPPFGPPPRPWIVPPRPPPSFRRAGRAGPRRWESSAASCRHGLPLNSRSALTRISWFTIFVS